MTTRSFTLGAILIVVLFIFAVGALAIYYSGPDSTYDQKTPLYDKQIVINKYDSQPSQQVQPTPGVNCNQQVVEYYNGQPVVNCASSGAQAAGAYTTPSTQVNIQLSGGSYGGSYGGYYPYPYRYYPSYYYYYPYYRPPYYYPPHYPRRYW